MFSPAFKLGLIGKMMKGSSGSIARVLMPIKRFLFGWITPTSWFPSSWGSGKGFFGRILGFIVNYGDNIAFSFVVGENTVALLFALTLSISSGEPVGFAGTPGGPGGPI